MQARGRHRQPRDRARLSDGIVDRSRDRGAGRIDAAFACTFEAEWIAWAWRILGEQQVRLYDWNRSALSTFEVYRSALDD